MHNAKQSRTCAGNIKSSKCWVVNRMDTPCALHGVSDVQKQNAVNWVKQRAHTWVVLCIDILNSPLTFFLAKHLGSHMCKSHWLGVLVISVFQTMNGCLVDEHSSALVIDCIDSEPQARSHYLLFASHRNKQADVSGCCCSLVCIVRKLHTIGRSPSHTRELAPLHARNVQCSLPPGASLH